MHHHLELLHSKGFGCTELENLSTGGDVMDDKNELLDFDHSGYWRNPSSTIVDDHPTCFVAPTLHLEQELLELSMPVFNDPLLGGIKNDPMLSSSWDENCDIFKHEDTMKFNKVIVEHIRKDDEQFSEAINHLEDHSYFQNEPVADCDNSNSVTQTSNSSSESEEIDVEYIEPEPVKQTRKYHLKRNTKLQNTMNTRTIVLAKQVSKANKSYHNELERKRRLEQRQCLDYLRCKLGLPDRASKMLILTTGKEQIEKLKREESILKANYRREIQRNEMLSSRLLKLMGES